MAGTQRSSAFTFDTMNNTALETTQIDHDAIAFCAYMLWDNEGRPAGRDQELWLKAEAQLREAAQRNGKPNHLVAARDASAPVEPKPASRILFAAASEKSPKPAAPQTRRKAARKR